MTDPHNRDPKHSGNQQRGSSRAGKPWTSEDTYDLRILVETEPLEVVAAQLQRDVEEIKRRIAELQKHGAWKPL